MRIRQTLVAVCALAVGVPGCHHNASMMHASIPESVHSSLLNVLQPLPQQSIRVHEDSAPSVFPNTRFFTATRVPPFGAGEDVRPDRATLVISAADTVLVTRVADLRQVWATTHIGPVTEPTRALETVLTLLEKTAVIQSSEIVRSTEQLKSRYGLLDDSTRLGTVGPPSAHIAKDMTVVRVVTDGRGGVVRYEFTFDHAGPLTIRSDTLARYITRM